MAPASMAHRRKHMPSDAEHVETSRQCITAQGVQHQQQTPYQGEYVVRASAPRGNVGHHQIMQPQELETRPKNEHLHRGRLHEMG